MGLTFEFTKNSWNYCSNFTIRKIEKFTYLVSPKKYFVTLTLLKTLLSRNFGIKMCAPHSVTICEIFLHSFFSKNSAKFSWNHITKGSYSKNAFWNWQFSAKLRRFAEEWSKALIVEQTLYYQNPLKHVGRRLALIGFLRSEICQIWPQFTQLIKD